MNKRQGPAGTRTLRGENLPWQEARRKLAPQISSCLSQLDELSGAFEQRSGALDPTLYLFCFGAHSRLSRVKEELARRDPREDGIAIIAWAARGLLELEVLVEFVLSSDANLERFRQDVAVDEIEFFQAWLGWLGSLGSRAQKYTPLFVKYLDVLEETHGQRQRPLKRLSILHVARTLGRATEYTSQNRIYSKALHSTAWSTFLRPGEYRLKEAFAYAAVRHAVLILQRLRAFAGGRAQEDPGNLS